MLNLKLKLKRVELSAMICAILVTVPIFINLSGGVSLAPQYSGELTGSFLMPFSALFMPIAFLFFLLSIPIVSSFSWGGVALVSALLMCYLLGFAISAATGQLDYLYERSLNRFLQTVYPISGFFVAYIYCSHLKSNLRPTFLFEFFAVFVKLTALYMVLYGVQTFLTGSSSRFTLVADNIGPFYNPKIKRFFPCLLAVASVYSFSRFFVVYFNENKFKSTYLLLGIGLLLSMFLFWSRTATLMYLVGMVSLFLSLRALGFKVVVGVVSCIFLGFLVAFINDLILILDEGSSLARSLNTVLQIFGAGGAYNDGDDVRWSRIWAAFAGTFSSPFGDGFTLHDQYLFPIRDILVAENGYLDVGVRGGLPAVCLFFLICFRAISRINLLRSIDESQAVAVKTSFVAIVFGGMPWLHLSTELYFAMFLWFFLGIVFSLRSRLEGGFE